MHITKYSPKVIILALAIISGSTPSFPVNSKFYDPFIRPLIYREPLDENFASSEEYASHGTSEEEITPQKNTTAHSNLAKLSKDAYLALFAPAIQNSLTSTLDYTLSDFESSSETNPEETTLDDSFPIHPDDRPYTDHTLPEELRDTIKSIYSKLNFQLQLIQSLKITGNISEDSWIGLMQCIGVILTQLNILIETLEITEPHLGCIDWYRYWHNSLCACLNQFLKNTDQTNNEDVFSELVTHIKNSIEPSLDDSNLSKAFVLDVQILNAGILTALEYSDHWSTALDLILKEFDRAKRKKLSKLLNPCYEALVGNLNVKDDESTSANWAKLESLIEEIKTKLVTSESHRPKTRIEINYFKHHSKPF